MSRYVDIAEGLLQAIADGVLQPGAALPSVRALARREGTTPATAGRAYAELARAGAIVSAPRRVARVAPDGAARARARLTGDSPAAAGGQRRPAARPPRRRGCRPRRARGAERQLRRPHRAVARSGRRRDAAPVARARLQRPLRGARSSPAASRCSSTSGAASRASSCPRATRAGSARSTTSLESPPRSGPRAPAPVPSSIGCCASGACRRCTARSWAGISTSPSRSPPGWPTRASPCARRRPRSGSSFVPLASEPFALALPAAGAGARRSAPVGAVRDGSRGVRDGRLRPRRRRCRVARLRPG